MRKEKYVAPTKLLIWFNNYFYWYAASTRLKTNYLKFKDEATEERHASRIIKYYEQEAP
jgi:hypothetical protein